MPLTPLLPTSRRAPRAQMSPPPPGRGRRTGAALLLTLAVLAGAAVVHPAPASAAVSGPWPQEMLDQVNALRAANGAGPLRSCPNLVRAAQVHTDAMAATGFFSHTGPDGSSYVGRAEASGYTGWHALGENIASGFASVPAVMSAWWNSAGHRANLLEAAYTDVGFALSYAPDGTTYWAQEFGAGGRCQPNTFGNLDAADSPGPARISVRGWVYDMFDPSAALPVTVDVDGVAAATVTAGEYRPDVAAALPEAGAAHGFSTEIVTRGGTHQVCAYATNPATGATGVVGCRAVVVAGADPFGAVDPPAPAAVGAAEVRGWAIDPDAAGPVTVHVYVDGVARTALVADQNRPDVGAAFPAQGSAHGYATTLTGLAPGPHQVCAYGINRALGTNALLGCRYPLVASGAPIGNFDSVAATGPGTVVLAGWAADPETTAPIGVHVYVDGQIVAAPVADQSRPDVGAAFPLLGAAHGWSLALRLAPGTHTLCAYAINVGVGDNVTLGCRGIAVAAVPGGDLNLAALVAPRTVRVVGWAIDPDTAAPIVVHVYVDGAIAGATTASTPRPDVAAAFAWYGPNHGYDLTVAVGPGSHRVCAYGINTAGGTSNPLLACRSVTA